MDEKLLQSKKNGMPMLLLIVILYALAVAGVIWAGTTLEGWFVPAHLVFAAVAVMAVSIAWLCLGWILALGLKILKPQEALVLTPFGK